MSSMFRSLRVFNYRTWFAGGLFGNNGQWMHTTAQSWVVLTVLTDESAAVLGIALALQFLPPLLLMGVTGWVADRFDRRTLLVAAQACFAALSMTIALLLLADAMMLPLMMLLACAMGTVAAFEHPARQAFVTDLVGPVDTPNAVALNSASFSTARLTGPAIAGVTIVALGSGWVFATSTACFLITLVALMLLRREELAQRDSFRTPTRFADGFRYVYRRKDILVLLVMVFIFSAFGMNFPIYASTMALELGQGADGFGLLTSLFAVGSVTGSLVAAMATRARFLVIVFGALAYGITSLLSAFMPSFWWYGGTIVFVGFSLITFLTASNSYLQMTTDPLLRGRVFAVYTGLLFGSTPVGAPIVGLIAESAGPRTAIAVAAGAGLIAALIGAWWVRRSRRTRDGAS